MSDESFDCLQSTSTVTTSHLEQVRPVREENQLKFSNDGSGASVEQDTKDN